MATVIRFARHGAKKKPFLRIVVQDSRFQRNGRFLDDIGYYDPRKEAHTVNVKRDRLYYWLGVGAQMSQSVKNRLKNELKQYRSSDTSAAIAAQQPESH